MPAPATLTVDLNALAANFRTLEATGGVPVHPVVKADSYGLGAAACAQRLVMEGARTFFVARAAEGERLRAALGSGPAIYVLDGCLPGLGARLRAANLRPVLNADAQLAEWRAAGGGACGIQIDTGMNRLGFRPETAPAPFEGLDLVLSHLACADDPSEPMNARQRNAFAAAAARYPGVVRSFANSGSVFLGTDYAFDAARPGICLYGGGPEGRPEGRISDVQLGAVGADGHPDRITTNKYGVDGRVVNGVDHRHVLTGGLGHVNEFSVGTCSHSNRVNTNRDSLHDRVVESVNN